MGLHRGNSADTTRCSGDPLYRVNQSERRSIFTIPGNTGSCVIGHLSWLHVSLQNIENIIAIFFVYGVFKKTDLFKLAQCLFNRGILITKV